MGHPLLTTNLCRASVKIVAIFTPEVKFPLINKPMVPLLTVEYGKHVVGDE